MSALRTVALGAAGQLSLGSLFVRLTLDSAQFVKGWASAQSQVTSGAAMMTRAFAGLSAGAGLAIGAVGALSAREAIKFESSFAGIRKTVNATEEEFKQLEQQMRQMGRELPINVNEINKVGEWAGQLGIQKEHIASFTRVMVDMGVTTNLSADHAAKALARLANIMQMPHSEFQRLGSVIVELGNNLATTEEEIVNMALRIGGAGKLVGMAEHEVLALAGALSSLGVRAELGGNSISRMMRDMYQATFDGGEKLQIFAQTAQMSSDQFVKAFREDAAGTITAFIEGLAAIESAGGNVLGVLDSLSLDTIRLTDVILRSAGAGDTFSKTFRLAARANEENNALTIEAEKRYGTLASQLKVTLGIIRDMAITIGNVLMPIIETLNNMLQATLKDAEGMNGAFGFFVRNIGPAFIYIIKQIGDIIYGWQLVIKTGEVAFLGMAAAVLGVFTKVTQAIADRIAGVVNAIGAGIDLAITGINKLLPKAQELGKLNLNITATLPESVKVAAQATKEAFDQSLAELDALAAKGQFSDRFQAEYDKVTQVVVEENDKIVEDIKETVKEAVQAVAPLSDRMQKALKDLQEATKKQAEGSTLGADLDMGRGRNSSVLNQFQDPAMEAMTRIAEERRLAEENLALLMEMDQMELEMTEAMQQKKLEMIEAYNEKLKALQMAQAQVIFQTSSKMFDDLANIAEAFGGRQTGIFKAMFAASKAFAVAESIIKIQQGIAAAAAMPWPANLAAIASVVSATANIVSTIQSVKLEFAGKREMGGPVSSGKAFLVGEAGPEMFVPNSAGNIIPNDEMGGRVTVVVNNYTDAQADVTERTEGNERVIEIMIRRTKSEIGSEIRDGRGDVTRAMESTFGLKRGKT